jgi:hypothetical protein
MRPHVLVQQVLAPGESRRVTVDLPRADLRLRVERWPGIAELAATPVGISSRCTARVVAGGIDLRPAVVRAGEVALTLTNETGRHQVVRLELSARKSDAVTAVTAMTHPSFQGLLSDELLAHGEHLMVSHMAFLAVAIADRHDLFHERGDAYALARFSELAEHLRAAVERHHGAVFRPGLEQTLAAFPQPAAALRAATAVAASTRPLELGRRLRAAVHAGRCLALTRGGKVDYFGETVDRVTALLSESRPDRIAVSQAIEEDPAALSAMHHPPVTRRVVVAQTGAYGGRRVIQLVVGDGPGASDYPRA